MSLPPLCVPNAGHPQEPSGTGEADPRAHGNTARPLEQLPAIKLINGLTRAIDEPTSAGDPPPIFPPERRPGQGQGN
jgi:hypothetical protein